MKRSSSGTSCCDDEDGDDDDDDDDLRDTNQHTHSLTHLLTHIHLLTYSLVTGRLVEDVLGDNSSTNSNNNNKVPMEKVVMLIWQFRDDPSVITFMARFMTKVRSIVKWVVVVVCTSGGENVLKRVWWHTYTHTQHGSHLFLSFQLLLPTGWIFHVASFF